MSDDASSLSGFDYTIDKTWDGLPVDHDPIHVKMKWHFAKQRGKPHKRVIKVNFEAPLFDDPEAPPDPPGILPGSIIGLELCFETWFLILSHMKYCPSSCYNDIRFLNSNSLEELGKHVGEELELEITNKFVGNVWNCELEIPLAYLPGSIIAFHMILQLPDITKFNSFAIHGTGSERVYEALNPVTDGNFEEPDFHRLQFYGKINMRRLLPDGYGAKPFIDYKYGDIWKDHY
ncbi:hypothetical protein DICVIV_09617 [Dictyocaulus viviparus]|uniref:Uncharacterized protein n=1 Tax=Dictyocaulus viviparus TaxID=29172 RepID=A0A0D8XID6_DICVI|nr:hypothetical protein DICVIV_09617 [Dictyocaulus viviparus]